MKNTRKPDAKKIANFMNVFWVIPILAVACIIMVASKPDKRKSDNESKGTSDVQTTR